LRLLKLLSGAKMSSCLSKSSLFADGPSSGTLDLAKALCLYWLRLQLSAT
jgi:hypothetical protein